MLVSPSLDHQGGRTSKAGELAPSPSGEYADGQNVQLSQRLRFLMCNRRQQP
jgi:hypothetical protein